MSQQSTEQPAPGTQETKPNEQQPAPTDPASQPAPQQPQQTPAQQPQQPPAQQQPAESRNNGDDVLTALNALPERIVNAVREAIVPPKQSETPAPQQQQQQQTQQKEPGKRSFVEWWFGAK